jgi:hypothetical protein
MCGWMLAILVVPKGVHTVNSTWLADFSTLPLSRRRAYGRIQTTPFQCHDATLKRLPAVRFRDANHQISKELELYALTLTSQDGIRAIVYFTLSAGQSLQRLEYRHRPTDRTSKGSVPIGITSAQFIAPNSNSGEPDSHVYRDSLSARLFLGSTKDNRISGMVVAVFPDSHRSFISGSFKARLVGIDQR